MNLAESPYAIAPDRAPNDRSSEETIYAIGDVHGCYDLLVKLLERIVADASRSTSTDTSLIFMGDYIDRGPASSEVLTALVWLKRHAPFPALFLKGNHEQALLDYVDDPTRGQRWLGFGGRATLRSYGVEIPDGLLSDAAQLDLRDRIVDRLPASHLTLLRGLALSHQTEHFIFVHAGIRPGVPLEQQASQDLLWIREGFLEEQPAGTKRVVHGHTWTSDKPEIRTHRIGIDTGAFRTGVLTAAKLKGEKVEFISATATTVY